MGQFSGIHILWTTGPIFLKVGIIIMWGCENGGHKICEFDRNQPSGYGDTRAGLKTDS